MKKFNFLLIFFLFQLCSKLLAQNPALNQKVIVTIGGISNGCKFDINDNLYSNKSAIIRIYPHIILDKDGSGGEDESIIDAALEKQERSMRSRIFFCTSASLTT